MVDGFDVTLGIVDLGDLTDYLFVFTNANQDANWQSSSKGYVGDVAVDGLQADERTSGTVPYAGTIYTNDATLGAWADIVDDNDPPEVDPAQAFGSTSQGTRISNLEADLAGAFAQINALSASPGFTSVSSSSLDGLNTQNGSDEVFVINVTSGLNVSTQIGIRGDAGDVFILRWDSDGNPNNGYQGQTKFQSGGAIVPQGGLTPTNFIHVAGDINASGGGSTPPAPYPQGPRFDDGAGSLIAGGQDFGGGGFFTGYWLTTGDPSNGFQSSDMSNAIFVGGWYSSNTKFSMTSGTSGVYVSPPAEAIPMPGIVLEKTVYAGHNGVAGCAAAVEQITVQDGAEITYCLRIRNAGDTHLARIELDDPLVNIDRTFFDDGTALAPGSTLTFAWSTFFDDAWLTADGDGDDSLATNLATVSAEPSDAGGVAIPGLDPVTDEDTAAVDEEEVPPAPALTLDKTVYAGHGGVAGCAGASESIVSSVGAPITYCFVITNTGNVDLTKVDLNDPLLGYSNTLVASPNTIPPGGTFTLALQTFLNGAWLTGDGDGNDQRATNEATAEALASDESGTPLPGVDPVSDSDTASVETIPSTATRTSTPVLPTATRTSTPVPPTATRTNTPVPPTATRTNTPVPPTATRTNTPVPPTATRTNTPVPPTATHTSTPVPPTATRTPRPSPTPGGDQGIGCIGDLVFFDRDNDGLFEPGEGEYGLSSVILRLYGDDGSTPGVLDAGDSLIAETQSDGAGRYRFCNLVDGDYFVAVPQSNFDAGGVLVGFETSSGNDVGGFPPDPDTDIDGDDNGGLTFDFGVASRALTFAFGTEPGAGVDGDGPENNLTLDFGFKRQEEPTGVQIADLRASIDPEGRVDLRWATLDESRIVGFHVYRSDVEGQKFVQVNDGMIPAQGSRNGSDYRFEDRSADPAGAPRYMLSVIRLTGSELRYGPVRLVSRDGAIHLPMLFSMR